MKSYNQISGQRLVRVEALSDGVFAIAMTILVLDLADHNATKTLSEKELLASLRELLPKFLSFFLSFLTLGIFWIGQMTQFDFISKYNRKLTWFTVMFLMFVSILPFTTTMLSNHFDNKVAIILYWVNILLIGILSWLHWEVAAKELFLNIEGQEKNSIIKLFRNRVLTAQTLYAVGAALCFINTKLSIAFIIAVQINIAFSIFTRKKKNSKKETAMTLIKTKFGFHSTAEEVISGIDLTGKRAIVTGGASGIGIETVKTLAKAGAEVTIAARNVEAGKNVADEIIATTGNRKVFVAQLDLDNLGSINNFVGNWKGTLDILINNAGVMAIQDLQKTSEGIEMQFMTNHLGHFALSVGLHNALKSAGSARIVVVASSGHLFSPIVFDDINFLFRPYDPLLSYGQAKTACILFAVGATKRWLKDGITINALNPGAILTNLQKHVGGKLRSAPELHKTTQQGAATSILLATSPLLDNISGRYFENCNEVESVTKRPDNYEGVAMYALDKNNADRLWDISMKMIDQQV